MDKECVCTEEKSREKKACGQRDVAWEENKINAERRLEKVT